MTAPLIKPQPAPAPVQAAPAPAPAPAPAKPKGPAPVKKVRILLEENDEVPPTGLFLSVNGVGYVLRAGEEAEVPEFLLDVLRHAETSVPRTEGDRVVGYKNKSRFPFRIL